MTKRPVDKARYLYGANEKALAAVIRECLPGDVLTFHSQQCRANGNGRGKCNCSPLRLELGAEA